MRPIGEKDAEPLFIHAFSKVEVMRYLEWRVHTTVEQTRRLVQNWVHHWDTGKNFMYALVSKSDQELVGCSCLEPSKGCRMEVGGLITKPYWGKGYGREAWRALVDSALGMEEIYSVWAVCDVENTRSKRALEKIGMQCEAVLRRYVVRPNISPIPRDVFYFSILK